MNPGFRCNAAGFEIRFNGIQFFLCFPDCSLDLFFGLPLVENVEEDDLPGFG